MKEQFLNYNLSQRLVNLGFDNKHYLNLAFVDKNNNFYSPKDYLPNSSEWTPLIQQAKTFLRETYGKFPVVYSDGFQWTYDLRWPDPTAILKDPYPGRMYPEETEREYFDTYQQAELRAIEKIIEFAEDEKTE